jgi:ribonucleoside-diphosphate reductase alpha chain
MEHYAWTVALTRMISAVFRRGGDIAFVVEELKAVFDPRGGQWMGGRYVPSLLAAIGEVIERHMIEIGFLPEHKSHSGYMTGDSKESARQRVNSKPSTEEDPGDVSPPVRLRQCPQCGQPGLLRQEGCDLCANCGYSKCS